MKAILLLSFLLMPLAAMRAAEATARVRGEKPNIVLILADDLGYGSLGCYGNAEVKTPDINRLAANGVRLTDFHSNGVMCSPTRAALMTGRYQQRCAWVADEDLSPVFRAQRQENLKQRWAWGISNNEITMPQMLRQAGYRTALIGKWHLGYDARFHPMNYGFDEFRGYVGGNVDYHTHVAGYGTKELDWWEDRKIQNEPGYTTDLLTKHACDFIERNKSNPFFLYLAHEAPHEPWQGRDAKSGKSPVQTYKEMIGVLDESVGAVVETLRRYHLETNTLVIFCSDNGPAAPRGFPANGALQGRKGSMLEGGHRVPFIASWPGVIPGGKTSDAIALTMDFLPTFAQLAGVTIPRDHKIDGIDLLPQLRGEAQAPERVLHWRFDNEWVVRQGSWKLIGKGNKGTMLVNLDNDIGEKTNLIQTESERASRLEELHHRWTEEVGER